MDRFPGEGARSGARAAGTRRPWLGGRPRFRLGNWPHLDPQRIIGGALILMLFAWIMQGPWARGFPEMYRIAGYISLASIVLFVVALVMYFRRGAFRGMAYSNQPPRWRGQVIAFPRRGG